MTKRQEDERPWKIKNRPYIYAAVLALVLTMFVAPERIEGDSMDPALPEGAVIVLAKDTYSQNRGLPEIGEVVILEKTAAGELTGDNLVARVAALPGDKVSVRDGRFYVNGEEALPEGVHGDLGADLAVTLTDNQVFLLCDNLAAGMDSRSPKLGPVEMEDLKGHALLVVWPFNDFGGVN